MKSTLARDIFPGEPAVCGESVICGQDDEAAGCQLQSTSVPSLGWVMTTWT